METEVKEDVNINMNKVKFYISKLLIKPKLNLSSNMRISDSFNGMLAKKASRLLGNILIRLCYPIIGYVTPQWGKRIQLLIRSFVKIERDQGLPGLVRFLKVGSVILQQIIGGYRLSDLTSLGPRISRTRSGYPRVIPVDWRREIQSGSPISIRMALTIFAIYREIIIPSKSNLSTITDGPSYNPHLLINMGKFIPAFLKFFLKGIKPELGEIKIFPILKNSPFSKGDQASTNEISLLRCITQLKLYHKDLVIAMVQYIKAVNGEKFFLSGFWACFKEYDEEFIKFCSKSLRERLDIPLRSIPTGKLGFKEEAAGKERVFAMVDPLTQWILRPLHQFLFSVLRKHETDGTFNQLRPLSRIDWLSQSPLYSYDLSAATDRLPIALQVLILTHLFGERMAKAWMKILVGRDYFNRKTKESIRYGTGQPMGALSSWAMLAWTHHFIVQYAAFLCGKFPTKLYAVLGDDIVIWDHAISHKYLQLMDALGVKVGLAKSVISPNGDSLEFAKKTLYKGHNVSPIPISEYRDATLSTSAALEFMRKYNLTFSQLLKTLGWGWRVTSAFYSNSNLPSNSRILHLFNSSRLPKSAIEFIQTELMETVMRGMDLRVGPCDFKWFDILKNVNMEQYANILGERLFKLRERILKFQAEIETIKFDLMENDPYEHFQGVQIFSYDEHIEHHLALLRYMILDSSRAIQADLESDLLLLPELFGQAADLLQYTSRHQSLNMMYAGLMGVEPENFPEELIPGPFPPGVDFEKLLFVNMSIEKINNHVKITDSILKGRILDNEQKVLKPGVPYNQVAKIQLYFNKVSKLRQVSQKVKK